MDSIKTLPFEQRPDDGYIRARQLLENVVPFSEATLWRRVGDGTFPKPCKLGPGVTAWRVGDVRAWLGNPSPDGKGA